MLPNPLSPTPQFSRLTIPRRPLKIVRVTDYDQRFGGIARLYGDPALARLREAHVCVIGLGGVGSWSVEALARSGLGRFTLVDLDEICVTNINRQIHALDATVGQPKAEALAHRIRIINPAATVHPVQQFFTAATADQIFHQPFDYVIDGIDSVSNKCRLIALCRHRHIPLITCGAAGGRRDPTAIRITDLAHSSHDRLLAQVRKQLRTEHAFPRDPEPFGIACVFSPETPVAPEPTEAACANLPDPEPADAPLRRNCNSGLGSASFVTGAFGFAAAAHVVSQLARPQVP